MYPARALGILCIALSTSPTMVAAQTFRPALQRVSPIGVQRGREFDWTLSGTWIGTASALLVSHPGITVVSLTPTPTPDNAKNPEGNCVARIRVAADVPPGRYPVRIVTRAGVSDVAHLVIGAWNEVIETEPNAPAKPQIIPIPSTVVGSVEGAEDVDVFEFNAKKGEWIVVDATAGSLGSPLVPVVVLKDSRGRELASALALRAPDATLQVQIPSDGSYRIHLRDLSFRSGGDFRYRLTVGAIPWVTSAFPAGGRQGTIAQLALRGVNLPSPAVAPVSFPTLLPDDPWSTAVAIGNLATNSIRLGISELEEVREVETNNRVATATPIAVPVVVNGSLASKGVPADEDWFQFDAVGGTAYQLDLDAYRLGSGLDPVLSVHDTKGNRLAVADDVRGRDPSLVWGAPSSGRFSIRVSDLHGLGSPDSVYRLTVRPATPDFRVTFAPDAPLVPAGGRVPVVVQLERRHAMSGSVALEWSGVPDGIRILGKTEIPAGQSQTVLVLEGDVAAKGAASVALAGIGVANGQVLRRPARSLTEIYVKNGEQVVYSPVSTVFPTVAIAGVADLIVDVDGDRIRLTPGGSTEIPVRIRRAAGYGAKVPVVVRGLPSGVTGEVVLAENVNEGKLVLKAEGNAPVGEYGVAVVGRVVRDELRWTEHASKPVVLEIAR